MVLLCLVLLLRKTSNCSSVFKTDVPGQLQAFDYTSSVSALIKILGWMNISQRHSYFISCLVFKSLNGNVPVPISNNFSYVMDRHSHSTRNADNSLLTIPRPNSSLYKRSLAYNGAVTWNKLPLTVRSSSSLHSFKHNYKASICS